MNLPFNDLSRSEIMSEEFFEGLIELIRSGLYLSGPHTKDFECLLSEYLNVPYVKALSSGTSALVLALKSLGISENSDVLITANSGAYSRIAVELGNLNPVYVDVEMDGLLTVKALEIAATKNTKALIVTHLYGQVGEIDEIYQYCKKNKIFLIEDCAQALGAKRNGRLAGSWGNVSTFSFYPTKNLGAMGDAGAIATSSQSIYERIGKLSQYGWGSKYSIEVKGGENSRMDEIQAFILSERLPHLDIQNQRRRDIWGRYAQAFEGGTYRLIGSPTESFVAHLAVVDANTDRDSFREFLDAKGIQTAIHYPIPDHLQIGLPSSHLSLPNTEYLAKSIFSLPLFPELTGTEIDYVCKSIIEFISNLKNRSKFNE